MKNDPASDNSEAHRRLEEAYKSQKPRLLARLRRAGRTLEEAEDLVHEVYTATMERLHRVAGIYNLPAWINASVTRRMIDLWRRDEVRKKHGETDVAEETLREIIDGAGLDPLDGYVRDCLIDALNDALKVLPPEQRKVLEAQVFGGMTFREIGEATGISIDTLTARKRYAVRNLSRALRHWIEH
ncbi:MAG: sigma-70 family RNA polymerase sigma factor [Spirochaetales bacterium]|nr:sigma-70 family RNA polymerase sigma factor [Spirochaetales bacterium]